MSLARKDRLGRFEREARVLASLNHPHIGAIYGVEETGGTRALILEFVAGGTIAERLGGLGAARGLPLDDALDISRQVADALDPRPSAESSIGISNLPTSRSRRTGS